MGDKICLTGTTGGLGSRVVHHMLNTLKVRPESLIISLYNPKSLPETYSSLSLDVRRGDFTSPESLRKAFAGATKLLLVSYPSIAHEIRVSAHKNAIDAAKEVGVKHIYYTSLAFGDDSSAAVFQAHKDTSAYLKKVCGDGQSTNFTIIKEGIYAESFPLYLGYFNPNKQATDHVIRVPTSGGPGAAWVARDDLGEGTARILTASEATTNAEYKSRTLLLSGDRAYTLQQVADMVTGAMGWSDKPLEVEGVGQQAFIDFQTKKNVGNEKATREMITRWSTTYPAMDKGELAVIDPLLSRLLGRDLKRMEDCVGLQLKDARGAQESTERYAK